MESFSDDDNDVKLYSKQRETYQSLAQKIKSILEEICNHKQINYLNIEYRAKSISSVKEKIERKKDENPSYTLSDMYDLAGIRVIAYVHSDLEYIRPIIKENFEIVNYKNKTEDLGTEKVAKH